MTNKLFLDLETTGLSPWYGKKITCICAKDSEGNVFQESLKNMNEGILIRYFLNWVKERQDYTLVFHNGMKFDIPFLCARACANGFNYEKFKFILWMRFADTMNVVSKWIKLNDLAILYGVARKNGDGAGAIELYNRGRFEELEKYCLQDVEVTKQVYEKMNQMVR